MGNVDTTFVGIAICIFMIRSIPALGALSEKVREKEESTIVVQYVSGSQSVMHNCHQYKLRSLGSSNEKRVAYRPGRALTLTMTINAYKQ